MTLNETQKNTIRQVYQEISDLNEITKRVFENPLLDGRSKEGRLIRAFMISADLKFQTARKQKKDEIEFSAQQKAFIIAQAVAGASSLSIASLVFPDREIKPLSLEQRAVFALIKEQNPDYIPSQDADVGIASYVAPKSAGRVVSKINSATGGSMVEDKMNRQHKICVEKLGINLNNSRFLKIVNNYISKDDRELFEQEFIRLTWDKPDLTADEINLYMNVCKEIVHLEVISKNLHKLNDLFDKESEDDDATPADIVRISDLIRKKSDEYHQSEGRVESLTQKLQGNRSERMKNRHQQNSSILALVQHFQDEEERFNMVKIAEMKKALVKEEAEKIEGMAEWKARIMGISIEDAI